jgi:glutamate-5-semialdehyde dehydrogenase
MNELILTPENEKILSNLRDSCREIRQMLTVEKNNILKNIAKQLLAAESEILVANSQDLSLLPSDATSAFRDRLTLNKKRIAGMAESLNQVSELPDPVGEIVDQRTLVNGLKTRRERAPIGLIFMIFESRPNVITEAFSLAFKSGNAILLRGGSESSHSAGVIYKIINDCLVGKFQKIPFFGVQNYDRKLVEIFLKQKKYIDVVVPRGGDRLIEFVQRTSLMPIIKNDRGLCHAYVAEDADLAMAINIVNNGKTQRPGVCNALETVLVHENIASKFIPELYRVTHSCGLRWHVDAASLEILNSKTLNLSIDDRSKIKLAEPQDWDTEYSDLILNCRIVNSLDGALSHIAQFGSKHSEAIITSSEEQAKRFQQEVDAAAVYWNASTRFTDGFELGLGGELGISTQKLHVRGPVGLRELTTPRWILEGNGQIRE